MCILSSLFICFIHLLYLSVDGHFSRFHILAVVNKVAINMGVQISFLYPVIISLGYIPRSSIVGSYGSSIFYFLWNHSPVLIVVVPPIVCNGSLFSTFSPILVNFCLCGNCYHNRCEMISHCGFNSRFPND